MTTKQKLFLVALVVLVVVFYWPTPYDYFVASTAIIRINRITGGVQYWSSQTGWKSSP
jgi:hypothetical protein